jgi:hypothetical protein
MFCVINTSATVRYVSVNSGSPAQPYTNWTHAATTIQDAIDSATDGDLIMVTNGIYQTGGRVVYGSLTNRVAVTKAVTLQSVNGAAVTKIVGYQVPTAKNGDGAVRCLFLTNGAVLVGFTLTNGATRAAGDAAREQCGGGVWCASPSATVSNCVLSGNTANSAGGGAFWGSLTNCAFGTNSASSGGAAATATMCGCMFTNNSASDSGGAVFNATLINCSLTGHSAYYGGGAYSCTLINCTITASYASWDGGGAYNCTLTNCALRGNSAADVGGGAYQGTLDRCILTSNQAQNGGGAYWATLNNCFFAYNSASYGGGAYSCWLNNCSLNKNSAGSGGGSYYGILKNSIIYYNTSSGNPGSPNYTSAIMNYCCTAPLPSTGVGNISSEPLFVSQSGNDLHLTSGSPCINAGFNPYAAYPIDLDGAPRIRGGTVDIGAYEFQTPASPISYAWLQQYALPTDGSADFIDTDHDGMNNWQEWVAGTDPTNPLSVLRMLAPPKTNNPLGRTFTWQSVSNRTYFLQRSTNLLLHPAFSSIQSNITGLTSTTSFTDTTATNARPYFYRVGVQ